MPGRVNPSRARPRAKEESGKAAFLFLVFLSTAIATSLYFIYLKEKPAAPAAKRAPSAINIVINPEAGPKPRPEASEPTPQGPAALDEARKAVERGDLAAAAGLLRDALGKDPAPEVKASLADVLGRMAVKEAGRAGSLSSAKELFKEAVSLDGRQDHKRNLAAVLVRLNELYEAASILETVIKESGEDPGVSRELKNIYVAIGKSSHAAGDMSRAAEYLKKALDIDPSDKTLKASLDKIKGEGEFESSMGSRDGSRFLVRFEGGENAVAGHLIGLLLEEAYIKVGADLGLYPAGRVEALLYSKEKFRDVTESPSWAGAIFDGRIKIPAGGITDKTVELEKVIFHEYTHAVVHAASRGRAPVWLNEGIAQYEEGKRSSGYRVALKGLSDGGVRLKSLEGSFLGFKADAAAGAYLVSLSAVEYIVREFGAFSIGKILGNLAAGMTIEASIEKALFMPYGDFERSWIESLGR